MTGVTAARDVLPAHDSWCSIDFDLQRRTLRIASHGLWDERLIADFLGRMATIQRRYDDAGVPPRQLLTMIDLRAHGVQVRQTIERLAPEVHRYHYLSKRTAILLSGSTLAKLQAERFLTLERHRFFTCATLARHWLATGCDRASTDAAREAKLPARPAF